MNKPKVDLYADGSCLSAERGVGKGGYGVCIIMNGMPECLAQGYEETTGNRMELLGIIEGLRYLTKPSKVTVYTDSKYVTNIGERGLLAIWNINGWCKTMDNRTPIRNRDLWEQLYQLDQLHDITYQWIKGHNANFYNEQCDYLAKQSYKGDATLIKDKGFNCDTCA